ncbi:hypothetical protein ACU4GD_43410 [Cupriavidus basilensis]
MSRTAADWMRLRRAAGPRAAGRSGTPLALAHAGRADREVLRGQLAESAPRTSLAPQDEAIRGAAWARWRLHGNRCLPEKSVPLQRL